MKDWIKEKMTIGEYMVFVQSYLNDTVDEYTLKEEKLRVKTLNELFYYIMRYNRKGIAEEVMKLQNKMNNYEHKME
jgi:uncharacterized protein with PhoU and TrkA domain